MDDFFNETYGINESSVTLRSTRIQVRVVSNVHGVTVIMWNQSQPRVLQIVTLGNNFAQEMRDFKNSGVPARDAERGAPGGLGAERGGRGTGRRHNPTPRHHRQTPTYPDTVIR